MSIGIQTGSGLVMLDRNLDGFGIGSIFLNIPMTETLSIKPQLSFIHKKSYWNNYYFEYMGIQYHAQDARLWRNYSFNISLNSKISENSYFGIGVSAEHIRIHSIDHEKDSFALEYPDYVDITGTEVRESFVKPAAFITGTGFIKLNENWAFIVESQIKFIFIGGKYGDFGDKKVFCTALIGFGYGIR
ncbi:hypothetical protein GF337_11645 [candidate division KSB1 bacterium]|nr:hypothetical protein [candidate division KSB1 bacterium]